MVDHLGQVGLGQFGQVNAPVVGASGRVDEQQVPLRAAIHLSFDHLQRHRPERRAALHETFDGDAAADQRIARRLLADIDAVLRRNRFKRCAGDDLRAPHQFGARAPKPEHQRGHRGGGACGRAAAGAYGHRHRGRGHAEGAAAAGQVREHQAVVLQRSLQLAGHIEHGQQVVDGGGAGTAVDA